MVQILGWPQNLSHSHDDPWPQSVELTIYMWHSQITLSIYLEAYAKVNTYFESISKALFKLGSWNIEILYRYTKT